MSNKYPVKIVEALNWIKSRKRGRGSHKKC